MVLLYDQQLTSVRTVLTYIDNPTACPIALTALGAGYFTTIARYPKTQIP